VVELPEIQKLIETYAHLKKDLVVIALSQDDHPSELSELRSLVDKKLSEKSIKLMNGSVGLVGLDPSRSARPSRSKRTRLS
jgi:hypothetical protein